MGLYIPCTFSRLLRRCRILVHSVLTQCRGLEGMEGTRETRRAFATPSFPFCIPFAEVIHGRRKG